VNWRRHHRSGGRLLEALAVIVTFTAGYVLAPEVPDAQQGYLLGWLVAWIAFGLVQFVFARRR
jgi:hypothetical protein